MSGVTAITLTGTYIDDLGAPYAGGRLTLQRSVWSHDPVNKRVIAAKRWDIVLDDNGKINGASGLAVLSTDGVSVEPAGATFLLTEHFGTGRAPLEFELPADTAGGTIDVSELTPVDTPSTRYGFTSGTGSTDINITPSGNGRSFAADIATAVKGGYNSLLSRLAGIDAYPGVARLSAATSVGGVSVTPRTSPNVIAVRAGWISIDEGTINCEIRQIESLAGGVIGFSSKPLAYTHSQDAPIKYHFGSPQIHVAMFGAKGDGTTDDSTAIARAIAALSTYGGTVRFGRGVYLANVAITTHGVHLLGEGYNIVSAIQTYITPTDTTLPAVQVATGSAFTYGCSLENIGLNGLAGGQIGLYLAGGCYGFNARRVSCFNFTRHCLKIGDTAQGEVISYVFLSDFNLQAANNASLVATLGIYGGDVNYTTAVYIDKFKLNQTSSGGDAVRIENAGNNFFSNSYWQLKDGKCINMVDSGATAPQAYMSNVNIDNESGSAITVKLPAGSSFVDDFITGINWKMVGKVLDGDGLTTHTFAGKASLAANSTLITPRVRASITLLTGADPDGLLAAVWAINGLNSQHRVPAGGEFQVSIGGSTKFRVRDSVGPVLPSYTVATRPTASGNPGAIIYVSDGGTGAVVQASNGTAWVNLG
jgi:hypothetical protein